MSLLLESLKKAALEKQKKEKNTSSQTEVTEKSAVAEITEQEKIDLKIEESVVFDSTEFEFVVEPEQAAEIAEKFEPVEDIKRQETAQTDHKLESSQLERSQPEDFRQEEKNVVVKVPEVKEPEQDREENPVRHNQEHSDQKSSDQKPPAETQANPIKDNRIPGFTPESGKAALAALLAKNKKIEKSGKIRNIYMLGLLLLTGLGTLGGYYYFLIDGSSAIVPTNQMQLYTQENNQQVIDNTASPENISSETVQDALPVENLPADSQESASAIAVQENAHAESTLIPTESEFVSQGNQAENSAQKPVIEKLAQKNQSPIANSKPAAVTSQPIAANSQPIERYIQSQPAVEDTIAQQVNAAYQAYQQGQWTEAQALYQKVLMMDTYNRDALLGAAAVAVRQGKPQEALGYYQQQLERDPQDEYAISGIMSLSLDANKGALLSEIDRRLQDKPANVHLLFLKASILAGQQQWSAAQETFFEAWNHNKNNADIVYNLAICLDRLNQPREAIRFYQMALSLKTSSSNFSAESVEKRLSRLTEITP